MVAAVSGGAALGTVRCQMYSYCAPKPPTVSCFDRQASGSASAPYQKRHSAVCMHDDVVIDRLRPQLAEGGNQKAVPLATDAGVAHTLH